MILAVYSIALILVAGGLLGLYGAINLIPTDLGLAYFHAGTLSLVAGLVTLALGFAARANVAALNRLVRPGPVSRPAPPPPEPALTMAPAATLASAATIAAAGTASLAAPASAPLAEAPGVPALPLDSPEPWPSVPEPAEPQRILPADPVIEPLPAEASPEPEASLAPETNIEPAMQAEPEIRAEPEFRAEPEILAEPEPPAAPLVPPLPDLPSLRLEPIPAPPLLSIEEEIRAELARKQEPLPEPAPEPAPEPVAGLIADEDLAAIRADIPALAPLATLEVVGSYDSGGTRFTMYSDGSVVASGPEGETRYPTLQDLRRHLDQLAG